MTLTVQMGATVTAAIDGHSAINGATIPDGSTITLVSSDPTVATVPAVTVPAGGAAQILVPVTVVGVGTTTFALTVTPPTGPALTDGATLVVVASSALTHATLTLVTS